MIDRLRKRASIGQWLISEWRLVQNADSQWMLIFPALFSPSKLPQDLWINNVWSDQWLADISDWWKSLHSKWPWEHYQLRITNFQNFQRIPLRILIRLISDRWLAENSDWWKILLSKFSISIVKTSKRFHQQDSINDWSVDGRECWWDWMELLICTTVAFSGTNIKTRILMRLSSEHQWKDL